MVVGDSLEVVDQPFASDIVGDYDIVDDKPFQHQHNDIVCVDVAVQ